MNCPNCDGISRKDGKDRHGNQRFKCVQCNKRYSLPKGKLLGSMILAEEKALMCLNLLVEGNSVRSTERITGVHRDNILNLLETAGKKCLWIQENLVKDVKVGDEQSDEVWSFVGMKQKIANANGIGDDERIGSIYTYIAMDSNTKVMIAWHLGSCSELDALIFLEKLYAATGTIKRLQMSTDTFRSYDGNVDEGLGTKSDCVQIVKLFKSTRRDEARDSPGECVGIKRRVVCGDPDIDEVSTSHVERSNVTMWMSMRRFTQLTSGFSKKFENLNHMLAIFFAYYNFCRIHKTLRCTPAMEAGLVNSIWTLKDLLRAAPQF